MSAFPLRWRPRDAPLEPCAVVGEGPVARRLLARLRGAASAGLAGVASARVAVIVGARERLPWVEGVSYLGTDARAPQLLLPTTLEPMLDVGGRAGASLVPAPLHALERRIVALAVASPIAVLSSGRLVSVCAARPLDDAVLGAWLARDEVVA